MGTHVKKAVWGFDPRWLRIEHLSDDGELLGVEFEASADATPVDSRKKPLFPWRGVWLAWILMGFASGIVALATIAWAR